VKKRRLGLYDLAASIFVVGCLIFLLAPEASHRGEAQWPFVVFGGGAVLLALLLAAFAMLRRRLLPAVGKKSADPCAVDFENLSEEFRTRFPDGGMERCDFRPHFDGFAVNAWSAMLPVGNEQTTREAALALLNEVAAWLRDHSGAFQVGDRLQLIVGFPESVKHAGRQIFKCWLPASGLDRLQGLDFAAVGGAFHELESWPVGVVWPNAEPAHAREAAATLGMSSQSHAPPA